MRTAIIVLILLAAANASAQPTAQQLARQYTEAGLAAQRAGEYEAAIGFYAKAYAQIPHPVLLFNMAQANRLAGRKQLALDLYRRYLEADVGGSHAAIARELMAEIERELAARAAAEQRAREQARAEAAQRASEEQRKAELARAAEAEREAKETRRATDDARRANEDAPRATEDAPRATEDARRVRAGRTAGRTAGARSTATIDSTGGSTTMPLAARTDDPGETRRARRRLHAYAAGGAGLVTLGVGLYVGSRARATWDRAHTSGDCDAQHRCNPGGLAAIDDAHGQARIATGATVLGVAALATGAALYWTAREPRSAPTALRAAPMVSPTAAGLVLAGGF